MILFSNNEDKEGDTGSDWLLTYSDMVSLILCFFVLLTAVSTIDMAKFEQISSNMAKKLSDRDIIRPIELIVQDLQHDINVLNIQNKASVYNDKQGVVLDISSNVLFNKGGATLKTEADSILKRIGATLNADRYEMFRYEVQGHTDEEGLKTGSFTSSWELSALRSSVLVKFFTSRGIKASRFRAVGVSDNQPKVPSYDAYGKELSVNKEINRRMVIKIEPIRN